MGFTEDQGVSIKESYNDPINKVVQSRMHSVEMAHKSKTDLAEKTYTGLELKAPFNDDKMS
jgi:hypothetical protein